MTLVWGFWAKIWSRSRSKTDQFMVIFDQNGRKWSADQQMIRNDQNDQFWSKMMRLDFFEKSKNLGPTNYIEL